MFSDAAGYNFQVMYKASFGIHVLNHEPWQCCRLQVNDPLLKSTKVWLNSLRGCRWFFQNLLPNRVQLLTCLGTLCPECSALLSGKANPMRIQTEPRRFKKRNWKCNPGTFLENGKDTCSFECPIAKSSLCKSDSDWLMAIICKPSPICLTVTFCIQVASHKSTCYINLKSKVVAQRLRVWTVGHCKYLLLVSNRKNFQCHYCTKTSLSLS